MLALFVLIAISHISCALPSNETKRTESLIILDTGVGHRSTPVTRWRTSIRSLTNRGANSTVLAQFGPESNATFLQEPINGYSLAYSPSTSSLFSATGQGIVRTSLDGTESKVILTDHDGGMGQIMSLFVAEKDKKIYFGTLYEGLIKKANFDGTDIEVVRNVSQGLNYGIAPSYAPACFYPNGIAVDEERGFLYWSAAKGDNDGSIRRAPLQLSDQDHTQILVTGINMPGQIRIVGDSLLWAERGRWNNLPTAIKYLDRNLNRIPAPLPSSTAPALLALPTGTLVSSAQNKLFFEKDYTGEQQMLSIQSFVMYHGDVESTLWFVVQSSGRTVFGKLVEVHWRGSGDSRGPAFEVLNSNTTDIGVPVGLEYVR
ncbi:hypothetical protein CC86DRAFT_386605 [Ophiobolus disseminans]|uniref:Uncharacterized protein n=1 Tax=Ophiobolus disseminans TaxID=1469910 RepID=A0A6A6ZLF4_9PLEO|nr:hypothetical protein CC86DRAFT_386605 [Ophiobolus disseminans]